ncbi:hypothetical protein K2173_003034 [Erythroxylum novogranatense]|uniref:Gnk2-homologous domain-containing protein n=1 Tax=Erythroxylum novogranatense TaxID=1862640 RepID=A0AAV8S8F5_9ROSI|nr:hypothetical protein K2173_003034 [Erythroxylum novogranatense]
MGLRQNSPVRLIIVLLALVSTITSVPDSNLTTASCNTGTYSKGDPFGISLAYVLDDLQSTTSTQKNYDYYSISPYPNAFAYGHASCNLILTASDCTTCLNAAKVDVLDLCQSRIGGRAMLHDCGIRYEQYPFQV